MNEAIKLSSRPLLPVAVNWSDDNKIAIPSGNVVHILEPTTKGSSPTRQRSFIRSVIRWPSSSHQTAPLEDSNEMETGDFSLDCGGHEGIRSVIWSPLGCFGEASCVIVVISSSFNAVVFAPKNNTFGYEWQPLVRLSDILQSHFEKSGRGNSGRIVSVAWSKSIMQPFNKTNPYLIAKGLENGNVLIFKCLSPSTLESALEISGHPSWVSSMAFSNWTLDSQKRSCCFLVIAHTDGIVRAIPIYLKNDLTLEPHLNIIHLSDIDQRIPTCVTVASNVNSEILGFSKANYVYIWKPWKTQHSNIQNLSKNVLSYRIPSAMAVSGITWGVNENYLYVYTLDGKLHHLIHDDDKVDLFEDKTDTLRLTLINSKTSTTPESKDLVDTDDISMPDEKKSLRIFGVNSSSNGLFHAICYKINERGTLTYRTEKHDTSIFTIIPASEVRSAQYDDCILSRIKHYIHQVELFDKFTPAGFFWDIAEHFEDDVAIAHEVENCHFNLLLNMLRDHYNEFKEGGNVHVREVKNLDLTSKMKEGDSHEFHSALIKDIRWDIYGNRAINCLKLLNYLYQNVWHSIVTKEMMDRVEQTKRINLNLISRHYLQVLMNEISTITQQSNQSSLSEELWEFIKRLEILSSHLSLQPNVELTIPSSLKKKHENESAGTDPLAIHEVCPVCASKFSVDSICKAHCENGHIWERCFLTFKILTSPVIRSCHGCKAKAVVPDNSSLTIKDPFLNHLVKFDQCIFCGNRLYLSLSI